MDTVQTYDWQVKNKVRLWLAALAQWVEIPVSTRYNRHYNQWEARAGNIFVFTGITEREAMLQAIQVIETGEVFQQAS